MRRWREKKSKLGSFWLRTSNQLHWSLTKWKFIKRSFRSRFNVKPWLPKIACDLRVVRSQEKTLCFAGLGIHLWFWWKPETGFLLWINKTSRAYSIVNERDEILTRFNTIFTCPVPFFICKSFFANVFDFAEIFAVVLLTSRTRSHSKSRGIYVIFQMSFSFI